MGQISVTFSEYMNFTNYNQKLIAGPFFGIFDIESPWKTYKSVEKLSLSPLLAFDDLIKKYGPIVKIYMGGQNAVLLGGKQTLCKQNLQNQDYGNTGWGVFKGGIQNQKDFWLKIT